LGLIVVVLFASAPVVRARAGLDRPVIAEFRLPCRPSACIGLAQQITEGPDGRMWFTLLTGYVGNITPSGNYTVFKVPFTPSGIAAGADGNLWVAVGSMPSGAGGLIARISSAGRVTTFSLGLSPGASPLAIARGPDGNMWFTEDSSFDHETHSPSDLAADRIGRITPAGAITEFSNADTNYKGYDRITTFAGNLWFTKGQGYGVITPTGKITELATPGKPAFGTDITAITAGPLGALWFTDTVGVGRIGRTGRITRVSRRFSGNGIAEGADGNVWLTVSSPNCLIRFTPSGRSSTYCGGVLGRADPGVIAAGPRRTLWFFAQNERSGKTWIGRVKLPPPTSSREATTRGPAHPLGVS